MEKTFESQLRELGFKDEGNGTWDNYVKTYKYSDIEMRIYLHNHRSNVNDKWSITLTENSDEEITINYNATIEDVVNLLSAINLEYGKDI